MSSTAQVVATVQSPNIPVKKDIYGLEIYGIAKDHIVVYNVHGPYKGHTDREDGYSLTFGLEDGKKVLRCDHVKAGEMWKTEILNNPKSIFQCAIDHFKNQLTTHHAKIKKLVVCGKFFAGLEFGIRSLESLEDLEIEGDADIQQFFFPNSGTVLRKLQVRATCNVVALRNYEETYEVENLLKAPGLSLTNEQFLALKAPNVHISIGELTVDNIFAFIKSWKSATTIKEKAHYQWEIDNPNFDLVRLFTLLDVYDRYVFERKTKIRHDDVSKGSAELYYFDNVLHFTWEDKSANARAEWHAGNIPREARAAIARFIGARRRAQ